MGAREPGRPGGDGGEQSWAEALRAERRKGKVRPDSGAGSDASPGLERGARECEYFA